MRMGTCVTLSLVCCVVVAIVSVHQMRKQHDRLMYSVKSLDMPPHVPRPVILTKPPFSLPYELIKPVCDGAFGMVWRAKDTITGQLAAVKVINKTSSRRGGDARIRLQFNNEVAVLAHLSGHANVLELREMYEDDERFYIATELLHGDDLYFVLDQARWTVFNELQTINMIRALARAVQHCHDRGVAHLDLKPENIVYRTKRLGKDDSRFPTRSDSDRLVLIDMGLSMIVEDDHVYREGTGCGSPDFIPPERKHGRPCTGAVLKAGDMWAIGMILVVALCGDVPKSGKASKPILSGYFSPGVKEIRMGLLDMDPATRWTISKLLAHPLLQ